MTSSGHRLSRKDRRDAMTVPSLHEAQGRFLSHQRAQNHSHKQLEHYARTFHDFGRFLESTDRPATVAVLTTACPGWLVHPSVQGVVNRVPSQR